ncbi:MAG: response regulator [Acidobacteriaceae bacterium]
MASQPATILCVDDEEPGLKVRRILLESAGYKVLTASSGREGIELFKTATVDAAILDYWMSGLNGVATARELKRMNPSVPIMILSAYGTILDEMLGVADVWVRKGEEDPEYLLEVLAKLIRGSSAVKDSQ